MLDVNTVIEQTKKVVQKLMPDLFLQDSDSKKPSAKLLLSEEIHDPNFFAKHMPYQYVDEEHIFINKKSIGFGFAMVPSAGADEVLMKALANLIKTKLPEKAEIHVAQLSHPWIGDALDRVLKSQSERGGIFKTLAENSHRYHKKAALQGYKNPRGIPARLRDHQCYCWVSKATQNSKKDAHELKQWRHDLEAEFKTMRLGFERMDVSAFLRFVRRMTTPNIHTIEWPDVSHEPLETLNHQCLEPATTWAIHEDGLDIAYETHTPDRKTQTTRVTTLGVKKMPKHFALWQSPDNFVNLFRAEKGITCPFVINVHFKVLPRSQAKNQATGKQITSERNTQGSIARFMTGAHEKAREWKDINDKLNDDMISLCDMFYSITLFSTPKEALRDETRAKDTFAQNGIELYCPRYLQMAYYLASLPFFNSEGLFEDLKQWGAVKKQSHWTVANFLPLIAEIKGSPHGMLLPSFRHQLCFIDGFDDKYLPITNFNKLLVASSGSGKSVLVQEDILNALGRGDQVFVIDTGNSYQNLCELVDGEYIDASTLKLNPFTLFDFENTPIDSLEKASPDEMIRNLLAVMASPHHDILPVQMDWLLDAVRDVLANKGRKACMDDIVDSLSVREKKRPDLRLHDLMLSLNKYTTQGIYGHVFNGEAPLLNKKSFVVLEMGAFRDRPELSKIVMFVMISIIQGQFYHSPRDQRKLCYIDEAWRWLCDGSSTLAARFIEMGFRTARKHRGGFAVIVQHLEDLDKSPQGLAIKSCSDIQIILRQGDFERYLKKYPDEFNALEETLIKSFGEAKNNGFSEMMIRMGKMTSFHRLFLDPFKRVLFSSDGTEFEAVQQLKRQGLSLIDAVTKVSEHYYAE